jgi:hypothetical protein
MNKDQWTASQLEELMRLPWNVGGWKTLVERKPMLILGGLVMENGLPEKTCISCGSKTQPCCGH